jgi:hypothetical protein
MQCLPPLDGWKWLTKIGRWSDLSDGTLCNYPASMLKKPMLLAPFTAFCFLVDFFDATPLC